MRKLKLIVLDVLIGFIVLMLMVYGFIQYAGRDEVPVKSEAIVVLGCELYGSTPSPTLVARLEKAIELYKQGYGQYIIVTGGQGRTEFLPEGERMKTYLVEKGIDEKVIYVENRATSTYENLEYIRPILAEKEVETIVIVTNRFHVLRSLAIADSLGYKASAAPADMPDKVTEIKNTFRECLAVIKFLMLHR